MGPTVAASESKTFTCTLISPMGRLLDCAATSVIFPAHDGQVGILYGHIPMLCQLGLGLMDVTTSLSEADPAVQPKSASFFIDGGFALVALNTLTVVAYEAIDVRVAKIERIKAMIDGASRSVADPALPAKQRLHQSERLRILARVVESRPPEYAIATFLTFGVGVCSTLARIS